MEFCFPDTAWDLVFGKLGRPHQLSKRGTRQQLGCLARAGRQADSAKARGGGNREHRGPILLEPGQGGELGAWAESWLRAQTLLPDFSLWPGLKGPGWGPSSWSSSLL